MRLSYTKKHLLHIYKLNDVNYSIFANSMTVSTMCTALFICTL